MSTLSTPFPVHYFAVKPAHYTRVQLVVRVVALMILGIFGLSLGALYLAAYLALPALAAVRLARARDPQQYLDEDGPRIVQALRWFGAVTAWFSLVAEDLPSHSPLETVRLDLEVSGRPTPAGALMRLLTGIPCALALAVLGCLASLVWLWSAVVLLFQQRVGDGAFAYLAGVQRWSLRLLAYQASLVEGYPPFSFADTPPASPSTPPEAPAAA